MKTATKIFIGATVLVGVVVVYRKFFVDKDEVSPSVNNNNANNETPQKPHLSPIDKHEAIIAYRNGKRTISETYAGKRVAENNVSINDRYDNKTLKTAR